MFNNAKSYNQDESQIYKDAVYLQVCPEHANWFETNAGIE